jgi:serine/threonine protein kinase
VDRSADNAAPFQSMETVRRERHRLALPFGYRLGSYEFREQLGFGSFGITYLAYDHMLSRRVAIKELLPTMFATRCDTTQVEPHSFDDEEQWQWAQERFVAEAQAVAVCMHPHILHVFEAFRANGTAYMVTRYEEGSTLGKWLRQLGRPPSESELRGILDPLLSALETVHAHHFLHRDIKPDNIYMAAGDRPILIDFGSARQDVTTRSMPMTAIVTEGYAPFEQYSENGRQGPWTDFYALGAVLYSAIVGKKPPSAAERAAADEDPCICLETAYADQYSQNLLASIDAAMRLSARARPQTTQEWRGILTGSIPLRPEETRTPTAFPLPPPRPGAPVDPSHYTYQPGVPSGGAPNLTGPANGAAAVQASPPSSKGRRAGIVVAVLLTVGALAATAPRWLGPSASTRATPAPTQADNPSTNQTSQTDAAAADRAAAEKAAAQAAADKHTAQDALRQLETEREQAAARKAAQEEQDRLRAQQEQEERQQREELERQQQRAAAIAAQKVADRSLGIYWDEMPDDAMEALRERVRAGDSIKCLAVQPGGGYVVIGASKYAYGSISEMLIGALKDKSKDGLRRVVFTAADSWAIVSGSNAYRTYGVPDDLASALKEINKKGEKINALSAIPGGGWYFVRGTNGNYYQGVPGDMVKFAAKVKAQGNTVDETAISSGGGWVIVYSGYGYSAHAPQAMLDALSELNSHKRHIATVSFTPDGGWVVVAARAAAPRAATSHHRRK